MNTPTIVIVTGANRGIGQAICQLILSRQDISPLRLFATSRKGDDLGLRPNDGNKQVLYPSLDISNSDSIRSFAKQMSREDKVDVLINNAGVNLDNHYGSKNARTTLDVNFRGTLEMCQSFIPLISERGRIVNLSSVASSLKPYSEQIRQRFRNANMTLQEIDQLAQEFERAVQDGNESNSGLGGPGRSYSFSKACVNAMTQILARQNPGLVINACCPGWVKTDMGTLIGRPPKTPEEGAKIPVRVGFGDIGNATGRYWANSSIRSREEGEVQEW